MTAPAQQAPPPDLSAGQVAVYALGAVAAARAAQLAVRAALLADVVKLWPLLKKDRLGETFPGWLRAMTLLVNSYHGQSAAAAASFYRAARATALQSPTPSTLIKLAPPPQPEWVKRAFGFSGPGLLTKDTARPNTALSTTLGTAARIALDGGRKTTEGTVKADPGAIGWYRVTDGDPCAFCALLASRPVFKDRGAYYRSRESAGFQAHNDCGCTAAPMFSHDQALPAISHQAATVYANRGKGDALVAFRKAWTARKLAGS